MIVSGIVEVMGIETACEGITLYWDGDRVG